MNVFRDDRASGSAGIGDAFLDELRVWCGVDSSRDTAALKSALLTWLREAQRARPSMALIHQFAARALDVVETGAARGDAPAAIRRSLEASCEAERLDLESSTRAVARTAAALVSESQPWLATLSNSAAVLEALIEVQKAGREPRVMLAEGRPANEGRLMATALAAHGIPVWLVVDAALPLLLSQARMVWIGADAVTERGVVNKVGSFAAALAAREHSVAVYALASRRKFIPALTGALRIAEMPSEEVWETPPEGVKPRNVYFELVPLALLRGVVVEDAVLPAGEAAQLARERALPQELAAAP